jgi:hypothetical protein
MKIKKMEKMRPITTTLDYRDPETALRYAEREKTCFIGVYVTPNKYDWATKERYWQKMAQRRDWFCAQFEKEGLIRMPKSLFNPKTVEYRGERNENGCGIEAKIYEYSKDEWDYPVENLTGNTEHGIQVFLHGYGNRLDPRFDRLINRIEDYCYNYLLRTGTVEERAKEFD